MSVMIPPTPGKELQEKKYASWRKYLGGFHWDKMSVGEQQMMRQSFMQGFDCGLQAAIETEKE